MSSKSSPLVSIWIPVFNGAHLIGKALESAINQTYKNIEIVVFDDCSSDNTKEVVSGYSKKDERVKYFRTDINIGQNKSYPKILELCSGELAHMLCCDDWLSRNYIEECVNMFVSHPELGAVTGRTFSIYEKEGQWFFSREPEVPPGIYTRRYFGRNAYRNFITSMMILGTVRRIDALSAVRYLNEIISNPPQEIDEDIRRLMQSEYGGEFIFCAKVMAKYAYLGVSKNSILLKTENPVDYYMTHKGSMKIRAELGMLDHTAMAILKFFYFSRKIYGVAFKDDWADYVSTMKIFFAEDAIAKIITEAIKCRFSREFFRGLNIFRDAKWFFDGYSFYEKTVSILLVPARLLSRFIYWVGRKIFRKLKPDIYVENYFLNEEKRFSVKKST